MKVKALIERLTTCDPEAEVIVYASNSEDADYARRVYEATGETADPGNDPNEVRPYVKGDWPDYGRSGPVVIIG